MMKMKNLGLAGIVLLGLTFTACSKDTEENGGTSETPRSVVITTRQISYEGAGQALEDENTITDMKACLFEKGAMTKVFENLQLSDNGYNLQINSYEGTIYMIANAGNMIDLQQMKSDGISEEEWKKATMSMSNGKVVNFFTGSLVIDGQNQPSQSLTLKRGVARFDLNVDVAGSAAIESLTLKNVAQSGYLFVQGEGAKYPADAERDDISVHFDTALSASTPGVLYVYEQKNTGIEVSIEAVIDGQHKVLTKTLEGNLKRNTIYTVTVRKNDIDIVVKVGIDDWEPGEDTEIIPQL